MVLICNNKVEAVSLVMLVEGVTKDFLEEFKKEDMGCSVMFLLKFIEKTIPYNMWNLNTKFEKRSNHFRTLGNEVFSKRQYYRALHCYNIALLTAPSQSLSLKLAYANRSALFLHLKEYKACLTDIDTCLSLGYPSELVHKLIKRKNECAILQRRANTEAKARAHDMSVKHLTKLSSQRSKTMPCASASVEIREIGNKQTVVAADDISVGEVISVETAFTAVLKDSDSLICCYYCQRFTKNLIPCDSCCFALFCNEECKKKCQKEYHNIECQIIMDIQPAPSISKLSLKTILKARSNCSSWHELIQMVDEKSIPVVNQISAQYRHLCMQPKFGQNVKYGHVFNMVCYAAVAVHALSKIPSFMPDEASEKEKIMHFLARQIMFHCVQGTPTPITSAIENSNGPDRDPRESAGFFPFTEKCGHSCNANVHAVGLDNKITLIALTPIKKGGELLISHGNHFLDFETDVRRLRLYDRYGFVCTCEACSGNWSARTCKERGEVTQAEKKVYSTFRTDLEAFDLLVRNGSQTALTYYKTFCSAIAASGVMPTSTCHFMFYRAIMFCHWSFQMNYTSRLQGYKDIIDLYERHLGVS